MWKRLSEQRRSVKASSPRRGKHEMGMTHHQGENRMKTRRNEPKAYFRLVRILERARDRNVKDWAAAVVRNATLAQRRRLVEALVNGFGPNNQRALGKAS